MMPTFRVLVSLADDAVLYPERDDRANPGHAQLLSWLVRTEEPLYGARQYKGVTCKAVPLTSNTEFEDADLGGLLFRWSWGEIGIGPPPEIAIGSDSSKVTFSFDERHSGLWLLVCERENNGSSCVPFEVRASA